MAEKKIGTFKLVEETGYDHDGYPFVTGVPVKQGLVKDAGTLVLNDEAGHVFDVGAEATARWADGSVKWALLTNPNLKLKGSSSQKVTLTTDRSKEVCDDDRTSRVKVEEVREGIRVDTGRLRFTVNREGPLVQAVESYVGGQWQVRGRDLEDTCIIARNGQRITYLASTSTRTVEIESSSSHRVVITVRGTHGAEDDATFGPYILRFECLADSPQLRLTHSLVFDGDPDTDQFCASEITLTGEIGEERTFGFGGDEGDEHHFSLQRADFMPRYRFAELYQDSVTHWRIERWVNLANRAVFGAEGIHSDGWMEVRGSTGRVAAAVRDCWQNHPKSLYADGETGLLRIGLYARRAEPLNFKRYSDLVYNHTYECPSYKQMKEGKQPPYQPEPRRPEFNAHGLRKTHNLVLMFDEPNPSRAALFYNKPTLLTWTPPYNRKTAVVVPAGSRLSPEVRKRTTALVEFLGREMVRCGGTGYVDYFDLPMGFDLQTQRWHHDYGGLGYLNNEGMPNLGFWHAWLLTGRREALELGMAMARHNNDIDSVYLGRFAGKGCRHNVTHWADQNREPRISQPHGTRFYGYLTGDRSYLDIVPVMLDLWRREYAQPGKMTAYGTVPALIMSMLTADEAGIEDCEAWLRQCADAVAQGIDERGVLTGTFMCDATHQRIEPVLDASPETNIMVVQFGAVQTFAELAERYNHNALREALIRFARYQSLPRSERYKIEAGHHYKEAVSIQHDSVNTFSSLDLYGYAYQQTGDEYFRRLPDNLEGQLPVKLIEADQARYGESHVAKRVVPAEHVYSDIDEKHIEMRKILFPLFVKQELMQHKIMAFWMHKLQGAAVLGVLENA